MDFEVGHFYLHKGGRCIAPIGEVTTYKWGEQLIIEEVDSTGHGISCIDKGSEVNENWLEIGKPEFMRNFKGGK